jgi:hypothetical protein
MFGALNRSERLVGASKRLAGALNSNKSESLLLLFETRHQHDLNRNESCSRHHCLEKEGKAHQCFLYKSDRGPLPGHCRSRTVRPALSAVDNISSTSL